LSVIVAECVKGVYRPRKPRKTAFFRLVSQHYEEFERIYPEKYADTYGYFRPVIAERSAAFAEWLNS
jgi:hypothetical protein